MAAVIDEDRLHHIFRNAEGHFPKDTLANREVLIAGTGRPENFLGADRYGNGWWAELRADRTQIWVQVREGRITNGGVNISPRRFDLPQSTRDSVQGARR